MDNRERMGDPHEATKLLLDGRQTRIWTALPGIIQSYDSASQTVVVQPSIQGRMTDLQNNTKWVNLPPLPDVPLMFPRGGAGGSTQGMTQGAGQGYQTQNGVTLTFPIAVGDECLVVFSSRCFDAWWQNGGVQPPLEARMHDLSDGFAIIGFFSQPRKLQNVSTKTFQIRGDDGKTLIDLDPTNERITLEDNVAKNFVQLDVKNQTVTVEAQKFIKIQSQDGKDHIVMDVQNQNVNITSGMQFTVQDSSAKNFLQFNFSTGTAVLEVQNQIQVTCPKTVFTGQVFASDFITNPGGVTLGTHVHPDPQGGTTGTGEG